MKKFSEYCTACYRPANEGSSSASPHQGGSIATSATPNKRKFRRSNSTSQWKPELSAISEDNNNNNNNIDVFPIIVEGENKKVLTQKKKSSENKIRPMIRSKTYNSYGHDYYSSSETVKPKVTEGQKQLVRKKKIVKVVVKKKKVISTVKKKIVVGAQKTTAAAAATATAGPKDEVEEGELGTLKWPENADTETEKLQNIETEKKDVVGENSKGVMITEKSKKEEAEKGEISGENIKREEMDKEKNYYSKWKQGDVEKVGMFEDKWRRGKPEKGEFGSWRNEAEKGEFILDRWDRREMPKDYYNYNNNNNYNNKPHRYGTGRGKGWKFEHEYTPPSGKYQSDDFYHKKEFNRSGSQHNKNDYGNNKSFSRWEDGLDIIPGPKILDHDNSYGKNEYSNGKSYGKEYNASGNRLKRHGTDSDNSDRKHYGDIGDYANSKTRRISDHPEHYSGHPVDRFYRNSSSSRQSSSDKNAPPRYHESSFPSKVVYDRHGLSDRSPRDRPRYYDYRDRSPAYRERSPYALEKSPHIREKSPYERGRYSDNKNRSPFSAERSPYTIEKSPYLREKSPFDRNRHYDHRNRSPLATERSPQDRARPLDRRDRTPNYMEQSPYDRNRVSHSKETYKKSTEKRNSQSGIKGQDNKFNQKGSTPSDTDFNLSSKESQEKSNMHDHGGLAEKNVSSESQKEELPQSTVIKCEESSDAVGPSTEELPSMEEDMDICDTPPHVPVLTNSSIGKWCYLDYFGLECGPSKLCEIKALVEEGSLCTDHFIKHLDSDRWVTVENAVSPLVTVNFQAIVSESITQLVCPPEAPGNLLGDSGDTGQSGMPGGKEKQNTLSCSANEDINASELLEDLQIDKRVESLLVGYPIISGKELETISEALQIGFYRSEFESWALSEGLIWRQPQQDEKISEELPRDIDFNSIEAAEYRLDTSLDMDYDSEDWVSGLWSCKGGDWKRNDEAPPDRPSRRKLVLNNSFPLCLMPKSGCEDPRWHWKDDLYHPSLSRRLDLPAWAFSCLDDRNDQLPKPSVVKGVKGAMLPVVRINACVVKDHGSFVSEPRSKSRGKERYPSMSARSHSGEIKLSSAEHDSQSKVTYDQKSSMESINAPKDRLCSVPDLKLHYGHWYYLDGSGIEQGPFSFAELQVLVDQCVIQKWSSVFRKYDKLWVPVTSATEASHQTNAPTGDSSGPISRIRAATAVNSFHSQHPQFIGFTRGKLHELVMKSFKSREFAVAINEVLDPWINARQPKKEIEKHFYRRSGIDVDPRATKRARLLVDGEEEYESEEAPYKDTSTFEDLCGDSTYHREQSPSPEIETGNWDLLNGQLLARVFHLLRSDLKSLAFASLTCKHWKTAVSFYKGISRQVDFAFIGPKCHDSFIWNIMNGYNKERITSMVLFGCTNVTTGTLEKILHMFPCISTIDVRGCSQFGDLTLKHPNVNWLKDRSLHAEDSHSKIRGLKQITDKTSLISKFKGMGNDADEFGGLKDYFDSVNKRDSANQEFRRSLYKRSKLFDARKSSSILSRDARMRRWAIKKSENGYKRMEEFLASSLKDIMKENTYDFFVPKVTEIEARMKSGYYNGHGLNSVKEDISRMCRDAIKTNNRSNVGEMNRIITLFIHLATLLEEGSRASSYEREEMFKSWKDDITGLKYKKRLGKISERKSMIRSNGSSVYANGGLDYGDYVSDQEIRKRLSKLNRKSVDSGSETSDELDRSSEDGKRDSSGTTDSETESDLDFPKSQSGNSKGDGYCAAHDGFAEDREWGARMTKASLVPPVTRKYEVIDHYVVVADEEEVLRKMRVTLPEDYAEKLNAQKNGTEDMELPEVKDYKSRKFLGDEVIEQEVYGIDPYTHNLLLDSMPDELNWSLVDKQLFVEDKLLQILNKQVRDYTGSGYPPMKYPLQDVVEEIEREAEVECDIRTMKMCHAILKAIANRQEDNYVAYRKGLGVVCNKKGGFGEDDFVVEFLGEVYPVWKWFEKQDGIRSLQKNSNDPAPEFYNIYLERPKGDADGYDLVVVDAMHKANYASRICHSCRPNCEAKVTAVNGQYQIGVYTVRGIQYGEEITFDYNSVTESKEEYEASVCLCGSQVCRGSYLNLTGEGAFQKVLKDWHGILNRHQLMLEACELNSVSEEDYLDLGRAGLGSCLLGGLPDWVVAYSARLVRFINFERTKLPEEILKHNLEEKRKYFSEICLEVEKSDAEVQAEGVYNQRLQNLAVTLDKVRYVMRCVFDDPKKAPPPLEKLSPEAAVSHVWKGEGSFVEELLLCISPHVEKDVLNDLKSKIHTHDPSGSDDLQRELQKSLLWLRDEVRNLPCTYKCRHDAAADLIHIYAYTKCFFIVREYKSVTSPPVHISPLDLGPECAAKLGGGLHEYSKTYGENYCLGQLIFWYNQTNADPDCSLARASQGCLSLPDIGSFYSKVQKPTRQRVYGPKTVKFMLARMEKQPQRPWPKDRIWSFEKSPKVLGSPMLDAVLHKSSLQKEMVQWLKNRPAMFQAMWDR
ncbi:hypothetical protein ACFE04_017531 [Oxalis oulophora]